MAAFPGDEEIAAYIASIQGQPLIPDGVVDGDDFPAMFLAMADPETYMYLAGYTTVDEVWQGLPMPQEIIDKGDFGGNPTPSGIDPELNGTLFIPDGQFSGDDSYPFILYVTRPDLYIKASQ